MKQLKQILMYGLPLLAAGALLFFAYRDFNFAQLWQDLRTVSLGWVLASLVPMLGGHLLRATRWAMLLQPLGIRARVGSLFIGVMGGYFANLILPRAGEVARCGLLQRRESVPVATSLGTVVAERALDVVLLLSITALAFLLQFKQLYAFFLAIAGQRSGESGEPSQLPLLLLAAGAVLLVVLFFVLRKRLLAIPLVQGFYQFVGKLVQGVLSIFRLRNPGAFLLQSVGIWFCYFLSTYFGLLAMPFTQHLGALPAFILLVTGSYGMVAPVQGGIGAYHFMVGATLTQLYFVPEQGAQTAALILHTSQTLLVLLVGGASYALGVLAPAQPAPLPTPSPEST